MQTEEARGFVFQALREGGWNQWGQLLSLVGAISARQRRVEIDPMTRMHPGYGMQFLTEPDKNIIMEVVWSLIVQGILVPGLDNSNQGWPFLRLTEYGRRCVAEDRVLPHDPDGYLQDFRREVPTADSTVVEYLTESLQCYIHGLYRSAAVMLGGASEHTILLLIESYINSIADPSAKKKFESSIQKTLSIFKKFELFEQKLSLLK